MVNAELVKKRNEDGVSKKRSEVGQWELYDERILGFKTRAFWLYWNLKDGLCFSNFTSTGTTEY